MLFGMYARFLSGLVIIGRNKRGEFLFFWLFAGNHSLSYIDIKEPSATAEKVVLKMFLITCGFVSPVGYASRTFIELA
jgi:hypothetical protein